MPKNALMKCMTAKKTITAVVVILVAIGGFVAGLLLLRQRQELREKAAVPGGQAQVSIFPTTGDFGMYHHTLFQFSKVRNHLFQSLSPSWSIKLSAVPRSWD